MIKQYLTFVDLHVHVLVQLMNAVWCKNRAKTWVSKKENLVKSPKAFHLRENSVKSPLGRGSCILIGGGPIQESQSCRPSGRTHAYASTIGERHWLLMHCTSAYIYSHPHNTAFYVLQRRNAQTNKRTLGGNEENRDSTLVVSRKRRDPIQMWNGKSNKEKGNEKRVQFSCMTMK